MQILGGDRKKKKKKKKRDRKLRHRFPMVFPLPSPRFR